MASLPDPYPPIYKNLPPFTEADPFGTLPYNRRIRETFHCLLQWVNLLRSLAVFNLPRDRFGSLVPPSEWHDYRRSHNFLFPSCLCAMASTDRNAHTEAAVYATAVPGLKGEYVAACAAGKCKYFVKLDRIYRSAGHPTRLYTERDANGPIPAPITPSCAQNMVRTPEPDTPRQRVSSKRRQSAVNTPSDVAEGSNRAGKRRRVESTVDVNPFIDLPSAVPSVDQTAMEPFQRILRLDDHGLTLHEFRSLLVICQGCSNWVGTKSAFSEHACVPPPVIDLTAASDGE